MNKRWFAAVTIVLLGVPGVIVLGLVVFSWLDSSVPSIFDVIAGRAQPTTAFLGALVIVLFSVIGSLLASLLAPMLRKM